MSPTEEIMLSKYVARYLIQTLPISQAEFVYGYALTKLMELIHSCLWCYPTVHATDDYLQWASSHCARTSATANGDLVRPQALAQPKPAQRTPLKAPARATRSFCLGVRTTTPPRSLVASPEIVLGRRYA